MTKAQSLDIADARIQAQGIAHAQFKSPEAVVAHLLAMQAQDFAMSKWAIGLRAKNVKELDVEKALNAGKILRTHLLRPTWHLISAGDIYWVLEISKDQIRTASKGRLRELEITTELVKKCRKILEQNMRGGNSLSRDTIRELFVAKKIATDNNRLSHMLEQLELDAVICSGVSENQKHTYALLEERVPTKKMLSREEALHTLANRYYRSRGPATLDDFQWWSGLKKSDAGRGLEMLKKELNHAVVDGKTYWFFEIPEKSDPSFFLLPAYDELGISYKDRSAIMSSNIQKNAISINGIFWPVMMHKNSVCGLWKRNIKDNKVAIVGSNLVAKNAVPKKLFEQQARLFADFLEKKCTIELTKSK